MIFNIDPSEIIARAREVRLLVLDVDGVLTAGELFLADSGEEIKAFSTLDGQGVKLLQDAGVQVAIISGRKSPLVARRAENLGISQLFQGREDKLNALTEMCSNSGLTPDMIAYVGDDLPDIKVMKAVRLSFAVENAHISVKETAHAQTQKCGGNGAVREVCDFILQAQDKYDDAIAHFL
ncbi:MAG: HAD-IIIA family hydrolase [Gammaproteobacteria bacterium]|nr:HAD-IIIA family hydrolase [Gammaproteobacteria bacterium]MDP2140216.1 HAD-IIIA family hydrolase [Gammaproteobacteria bacterium]MDP2348092.1 HAD-IIIA family hydrolase [Gammaproteobacteria bacterium]